MKPGTESHYGASQTTPQVHHVNGRPHVPRPQGLDLHGMRTEGNEGWCLEKNFKGQSPCANQVTMHYFPPGNRTESPDADSAFSDNVSMLSSESSASSGGSGGNGNGSTQTPQRPTQPLTPSKVPVSTFSVILLLASNLCRLPNNSYWDLYLPKEVA